MSREHFFFWLACINLALCITFVSLTDLFAVFSAFGFVVAVLALIYEVNNRDSQ